VNRLAGAAFRRGRCLLGLIAAVVSACATPPASDPAVAPPTPHVAKVDESMIVPLLGYYQELLQLPATELQRERGVLVALPPSPIVQLRLAMLLGQPRAPLDLARALALLDAVLRSRETTALSVQPLARALAAQFQERLRLETQNERLQQQLRESQRRSSELQEKLDALTDIERALPVRPNADKHLPGGQR